MNIAYALVILLGLAPQSLAQESSSWIWNPLPRWGIFKYEPEPVYNDNDERIGSVYITPERVMEDGRSLVYYTPQPCEEEAEKMRHRVQRRPRVRFACLEIPGDTSTFIPHQGWLMAPPAERPANAHPWPPIHTLTPQQCWAYFVYKAESPEELHTETVQSAWRMWRAQPSIPIGAQFCQGNNLEQCCTMVEDSDRPPRDAAPPRP